MSEEAKGKSYPHYSRYVTVDNLGELVRELKILNRNIIGLYDLLSQRLR